PYPQREVRTSTDELDLDVADHQPRTGRPVDRLDAHGSVHGLVAPAQPFRFGGADGDPRGVGTPPAGQPGHGARLAVEPVQACEAQPSVRIAEVTLALGAPLTPLRSEGVH